MVFNMVDSSKINKQMGLIENIDAPQNTENPVETDLEKH